MTFEAEGIRTAQRGADIAILVDYEFGDREAVGSHMLLARRQAQVAVKPKSSCTSCGRNLVVGSRMAKVASSTRKQAPNWRVANPLSAAGLRRVASQVTINRNNCDTQATCPLSRCGSRKIERRSLVARQGFALTRTLRRRQVRHAGDVPDDLARGEGRPSLMRNAERFIC
jgi:hypothetical protein